MLTNQHNGFIMLISQHDKNERMSGDLEDSALQRLDRFEVFVHTISGIYKQIQKIKDMEMRELGLKGPHVMSLFYLSRHAEGLTAAQLCRLISIDKAAISRVLAQLQERGLIAYPTAARRYRAPAVLTPEGKTVSVRIEELICSIVFQADRGVSDAARESMYQSLNRIAENLETLAPAASASAADFEQIGEK